MNVRPAPGGHLRRHGVAYAALAVALCVSPLPSVAADLVTTADIANGAVTTAKLAPDSVVSGRVADESLVSADVKDGRLRTADLAPSARGAKVIRYNLGAWDFAASPASYYVVAELPGTWNAEKVATSSWSATMFHNHPDGDAFSHNFVIPGPGYQGTTDYQLQVNNSGKVYISAVGPGEAYTDIRVYRTVATSSFTYPTAKLRPAPRERGR